VHLVVGQLRALAVLADELSFTRAARRLGIAQPALSAQISRIERRLGRKLVERSTRSVVLTPAGLELVDRARRFLAEADNLPAGPDDQLRRGSSG
jgi:DNA-binding transcriptional LysR family regulator